MTKNTSTDNLNLSDEYKDSLDTGGFAEFASAEPSHFDMMPAILDHLTYIEETVGKDGDIVFTRKRLTPTEKELYRVYRQRAGNGVCWKNAEDLADQVGCGINTIKDARESLSQPFEQLEGQPLLVSTVRYIATERNGRIVNKRPSICVTLNNIWRWNNAFMDLFDHKNPKYPKRKEVISKKEAEVAIEKMGQKGKVEVVHNLGAHHQKVMSRKAHHENVMSSLGGSSLKRDVNISLGNISPCSKTNPTATARANAVARCFLDKSNVEECFRSEASAFDALQEIGFSGRIAGNLVAENSLDKLLLSVLYLKDCLKQDNIKNTVTGYLLNIIKHDWYKKALE